MQIAILRISALMSLIVVFGGVRAADTPKPPAPAIVDGVYLKAFVVAYADFRSIRDLPADKKSLERYTIRFEGDRTHVFVSFIPKLPEGWFGAGGETPYGREVTYSVERRSAKITKRAFGE